MLAILKRTNPEEFNEALTNIRRDLLEEAAHVFASSTQLPTKSLAYTLKELGIVPLDADRVRRYKRSKELRRTMWRTYQQVMFVFATLFFALTAYSIITLIKEQAFMDRFGWFTAMGIVCLVATLWVGFGEGPLGSIKRYWERYDIMSYMSSHGMPEFALSRAIEVKKALPGADLQVEALVEKFDEYHRPRHVDPFLIAAYKGITYHIDVWGEGDFERKI